jgi:LemA protein
MSRTPRPLSQVFEIKRIRKEMPMRAWSLAFLVILAACAGLSGCGYSQLTRQDEDVKAAWSEVINQYQRRADLIPNLVRTVKGYANQEQQVLIGVTEARAQAAGSIQLTPELLNNPEAFARFQAAQGSLSSSLKSLIAVAEAYPDLKSNENFRDLQSQLEGTENRITIARQRYIDAVRNFNTTVRAFPTNLTAKMFDFQVKPNFTVANEQAIAAPPTVDFGGSPPAPPAPMPAPDGAGSAGPGTGQPAAK